MKNLMIAICLLSMTACNEKKGKGAVIPPADMQFVTPVVRTVPVYQVYSGQVFGESDIDLQPRVQGNITGIYFKDGQQVEKGRLLYTIDDLSLRAQIGGYEADLARNMSVMANTKSDLDRIRPLAEMKALSAHDLDAAVTAYESAKMEVKISEARLKDMEIQRSYTKIVAPVSGIIGISKVRVGDYTGGPGSGSINTVSSITSVRVRFPVSEKEYLQFLQRRDTNNAYVKELTGLPVKLLLSDGTIYPLSGRLQLTDRQIDPSTGSMLVEAAFANPQGLLRPGQYVKVRLRTDNIDNALLVPQEAVSQLQDVFQVYLITDSNLVVPRIVRPGLRIGNAWIIREGISSGDRLAMAGSILIDPKHPVRPVAVTWYSDSLTNVNKH